MPSYGYWVYVWLLGTIETGHTVYRCIYQWMAPFLCRDSDNFWDSVRSLIQYEEYFWTPTTPPSPPSAHPENFVFCRTSLIFPTSLVRFRSLWVYLLSTRFPLFIPNLFLSLFKKYAKYTKYRKTLSKILCIRICTVM